MTDLPLHEAVVGLLKHWADPSHIPQGVYALNLGQANQLFYFLILGLSYVVGVSLAAKLVLAATLLLLPVAMARTADHLGTSRWLAVLLSPLGIGWMFFWGLMANLIGLTIFFLALPSLDRFVSTPSLRRFLEASGWILLIHFAHDSTALFASCAIVVFALGSARTVRGLLVAVAPAVVGFALALHSRAYAASISGARTQGVPPFVWAGLEEKLSLVPLVLHGEHEAPIRSAMFVACALPAALFAVERWKNRQRTPRTVQETIHHFRFEIVGAGLLLGYFAAPANMGTTTLVYQRFLAPAWALLVLCSGTRLRLPSPWRLPRLLSALAPLLPILAAWPQFVDSDRSYTHLDECIGHMDPGAAYLGLELGPDDPDLLYRRITGMGHVVAELGGRTLFDSTSSPVSPVYMRPDLFWDHTFERVGHDAYELIPELDLRRFRYVLLRTSKSNVDYLVAHALAPYARQVFHSGDWTVLESSLPILPLDQPDSAPPPFPPPTLRKLSLDLLDTLGPDAPAVPAPSASP